MDENRKKALEVTFAQIEKQFGKGSIMRLGAAFSIWTLKRFPQARCRSTWRWESAACRRAGLSRCTARNPPVKQRWRCTLRRKCRKAGGDAAFIDVEHALDPVYAAALGRRCGSTCSCPSRIPASRRWKLRKHLVRSGAIDVVVVDSVAALVPEQEIEGEMGDTHVGPAGAADVAGAAEVEPALSTKSNCVADFYQPAA